MSKYIVIGGAGYIGSHLVHYLHDQKHDVVVFDNLSTGTKENLPEDVKVIQEDIRDWVEIHRLFKHHQDASCVFHLAALKSAGDSMEDPSRYVDVNINGTNNILDAMAKTKTRNLVFSSSAAVYGEPEYLPLDENHPTNPTNFYGFTKLQMEKTMEWYAKLGKLNYVALRYFNAAGYMRNGRITVPEKNPANLLPIIMETAIGLRPIVKIFGNDYDTIDGSGVRDYIHVEDLVQAHIMAARYLANRGCHQQYHCSNLTINLGTGNGYSVMEAIRATEEVSGAVIPWVVNPRRSGDSATVVASSSKAFDVLGWKAEYSSLIEIVASMWNLYKKHYLYRRL